MYILLVQINQNTFLSVFANFVFNEYEGDRDGMAYHIPVHDILLLWFYRWLLLSPSTVLYALNKPNRIS